MPHDEHTLALPTFPSWHRADCHTQALLADALASVKERDVSDDIRRARHAPRDSPKRLRAALLSDLGLDEAWLASALAKNLADLRALGQSWDRTVELAARQPETPPGQEQAHKDRQSDFGNCTAVKRASRGCPVSKSAAGPSPRTSPTPRAARKGVVVYPRRKHLQIPKMMTTLLLFE